MEHVQCTGLLLVPWMLNPKVCLARSLGVSVGGARYGGYGERGLKPYTDMGTERRQTPLLLDLVDPLDDLGTIASGWIAATQGSVSRPCLRSVPVFIMSEREARARGEVCLFIPH